MPWKAPELFTLEGKHTTASDVYSLGIVLWEISSCILPYLEVDDETQIMGHVSSGGRLSIYNNNENIIAISLYNEIIVNCWAQSAPDRPTSSEVAKSLQEALRLLVAK